MKIILGSAATEKQEYVKKAFDEINIKVDIEGVEVDSEITHQPLDIETTKLGAKNRALNAKKEKPDADLWIGLEGGLHDYGEGYHLITYAYIIDKDNNEYVGHGTEIHLPESVSDEVKKGGQFGDAIRLYAKDHNVDENLITRKTPFIESLQNAYANYLLGNKLIEYRKKVNSIILNYKNQILLVQLLIYKEDEWNTPGGGIKEGESPKEALSRELKEELNIDNYEIIQESPIEYKYNYPTPLLVRWMKEGSIKYRGQVQTQFIVKFTGKDQDIKLQEDELRKHIWVDIDKLDSCNILHGQKENVIKVISNAKVV